MAMADESGEKRSCFVIGPMRSRSENPEDPEARLKRLQRYVLEPLFADLKGRGAIPYDYEVQTPYDLNVPHIVTGIIAAIDRADIIVADITGGRPNTYYELAIAHALGRPAIGVIEMGSKGAEFDIRDFKYVKVRLGKDEAPEKADYAGSRAALESLLREADKNVSEFNPWPSPVINYYRFPMTYASPAGSLAQGYFNNFVTPVVESLHERQRDGYRFRVGVTPPGANVPRSIDETEILSDDRRDSLRLEIIIPHRLEAAEPAQLERFQRAFPRALLESERRSPVCLYHPELNLLFDIPSTLSVIDETIDRRMTVQPPDRRLTEWRQVERSEISHFERALRYFMGNVRDRKIRREDFDRLAMVRRFSPDNPGDLDWVAKIIR